MKVGDLVRYKHDKYRMGVAICAPIFAGDGTQDKYVAVLWMRPARKTGNKYRWNVELQHIQVKGEGRYGWRDAA